MELEVFKKLIKKTSEQYASFLHQAEIGNRYYENNTDILFAPAKKDDEGNIMHNADNRIPRNFHGLLVNQKASYAFTYPPIFDVGNDNSNKKIVSALGDEYTENCMDLCINASNTSIGWLHYWRNEKNEFQWAVVESMQIRAIYDKSLKENLIGVLRVYIELDEEDGQSYRVYEYWTDRTVTAYRQPVNDVGYESLGYYAMFLDVDTDENVPQIEHGFETIPFIQFWNNNTKKNDLDNIKRLIDVYDKVYSGFVNDLDDIQELIFILTNYGGTDMNGFLQDLKKYKVINLDEDGAASTLNIEIPIEARKELLDCTRKAIFEIGQGYDPQPENFGNQSGVALKFMYALLEMKVGFMETKFRTGFNKLIRAICDFYNLKCDNIVQTWTRNSIRNDTEQATICAQSVGIVSKRTILRNHPLVDDVDAELDQLAEEEQEAQEKAELYGFGNRNPDDPEDENEEEENGEEESGGNT